MPEWLIERGIGETRAALKSGGEILEARILLDGIVPAGSRLEARVKQVRPRTIAEADGQEYLLPKGAPGVNEGATLVIEITREVIPGSEPWKRPLARVTDGSPGDAAPLNGRDLAFPGVGDPLADAGWHDLLDEARTGIVRFAGGELRISPTPAMTLIDVDGFLPPDELALAGARAAGQAIQRLDIGGSIGIDLPTTGKAARQKAGAEIDALLAQPFERTAVNGFGFVQIVRPRERASLVELALDRGPFEARALLRRAALEGPGARRLAAHPAVMAELEHHPDWLDQLSRQLGGQVSLRADPSLPISGGHAERA